MGCFFCFSLLSFPLLAIKFLFKQKKKKKFNLKPAYLISGRISVNQVKLDQIWTSYNLILPVVL